MYVTNAQLKHICFKKVSKNYVPKRAHANVAKQHFLFFCPIFHPRFECLFSEWYWQQNEIDYSNLHREMVNHPPPPTLPLTTTGIGKREREWYCRIQNTASRGRRQTRTFSTLVSCRREKRILYIDLLARGLCHNSLEVGAGIIFWKNVFFCFLYIESSPAKYYWKILEFQEYWRIFLKRTAQ